MRAFIDSLPPRRLTDGRSLRPTREVRSRSRRDFLSQVLTAAVRIPSGVTTTEPAGSASVASKSLHILILGGTGHIGPFFVRAAVARGHKVAVFSRGREHVALPSTVERLIGDRNGSLDSIMHRDWDAVLDLATYGPIWVRSLGEALKGRIGHYTFISTISVYDNPQLIRSRGRPAKFSSTVGARIPTR